MSTYWENLSEREKDWNMFSDFYKAIYNSDIVIGLALVFATLLPISLLFGVGYVITEIIYFFRRH